jgi:dynein heavy chain
MFEKERGKWVPWMDNMGGHGPELDPEAEFTTIIVPTVDTVR